MHPWSVDISEKYSPSHFFEAKKTPRAVTPYTKMKTTGGIAWYSLWGTLIKIPGV
jgi:hypothetical protein